MSNQPLTVDQFYAQARADRLLGLRCESGHVTVPPRRSCRICQSLNMQVIEIAKTGKVVSFTVVHVKSRDFPLETPYTLAIVKLDAGGNLLGVINGSTPEVVSGSKVSVKFRDVGENGKWPRIFFELI
ncbi:MAG: Zn-ribbon domain-containing OB-fold protein [Nitrososphaerales archaeon]|jgi:uncharacterized protein